MTTENNTPARAFAFTSRDTYVAYRAAWKAEYKQLSQDIRREKLEVKEAHRSGGLGYTLSSSIRRHQARATDMLAELMDAKIEAQRQYVAEHTGEVCNAA